jgi:hypothetical protein
MYNQELIDLLLSNTNILSIWIDEDKDWHTSDINGGKEVKREEILKSKKAKNE